MNAEDLLRVVEGKTSRDGASGVRLAVKTALELASLEGHLFPIHALRRAVERGAAGHGGGVGAAATCTIVRRFGARHGRRPRVRRRGRGGGGRGVGAPPLDCTEARAEVLAAPPPERRVLKRHPRRDVASAAAVVLGDGATAEELAVAGGEPGDADCGLPGVERRNGGASTSAAVATASIGTPQMKSAVDERVDEAVGHSKEEDVLHEGAALLRTEIKWSALPPGSLSLQ